MSIQERDRLRLLSIIEIVLEVIALVLFAVCAIVIENSMRFMFMFLYLYAAYGLVKSIQTLRMIKNVFRVKKYALQMLPRKTYKKISF